MVKKKKKKCHDKKMPKISYFNLFSFVKLLSLL